jgi:hypothetical protein
MTKQIEPKEAFPYKPPTAEIKQRYAHIFEITKPLPPRFFKSAFDKLVALVMLLFSAPIMLLLKLAYVIEGWLTPENAGPMFFYYNAISGGRIIPKYKIRLIKMKYIEPEGAKRHDWIAFSAEWTPCAPEQQCAGVGRAARLDAETDAIGDTQECAGDGFGLHGPFVAATHALYRAW